MEAGTEQNGRLSTTDYVLSNERVVVPAGAVGTPAPQTFSLLLQSKPGVDRHTAGLWVDMGRSWSCVTAFGLLVHTQVK